MTEQESKHYLLLIYNYLHSHVQQGWLCFLFLFILFQFLFLSVNIYDSLVCTNVHNINFKVQNVHGLFSYQNNGELC